ncbi:MAG TPA: hypothetical protein VGM54_18930 [Chthoniobacter sp.]
MPPPPPALRKSRSIGPGLNGVTAGALAIAILLASVVGGVVVIRRARANREAIVQKQRMAALARAGTPPPEIAENLAATRALAGYFGKLQGQSREHDAAFSRLKEGKVLSWEIHTRADLEKSQRLVRDYLRTNQELTDTIQYGADLVRADLNTAKVPPAVRDSALDRYAKSQAPLVPLQLRVRSCDKALGESIQKVLDLLDSNWGDWHRDNATGRLDFVNFAALGEFKDDTAKISTAMEQQEAAQQELNTFRKSRTRR